MTPQEIITKLLSYAEQEDEGQWGSYAGNNRCKTYGRLIQELDRLLRNGADLPAGWQDVSPMIVMTGDETRELAQWINFTPGVNKMRVMIQGGRVKFKVNEQMWSAPLGKLQGPY